MLSKEITEKIASSLSDQLQQDVSIKKVEQVYGGDINQTFVLQTSAGHFFMKLNDASRPDMFEKEAVGLTTLKKANAVDVPQPYVYGEGNNTIFLVTAYVERGRPATGFWERFGYGLATLHHHTQSSFGFQQNNYIGSLPQHNGLQNNWPEFYGSKRIMPLMMTALGQHRCTSQDMVKAEKLCERLPGLFPDEPTSLLHGDLWSGNFMVGKSGQPVIYDPAVYYGHREMDIAMTLLFGGFDKSFYTYYNEAFPLEKNWRNRVSLCQLYPLLVHLVLFGGHYYGDVMKVIDAYQ